MAVKPSKYFLDMLAREKKAGQHGEAHSCDVPGCPHAGEYRAPKNRALTEYYHFCLDHVRDYNKNWDFFSGMSRTEIENHMYNTFLWDRPTWDMVPPHTDFERLQRRIYENLDFDHNIRFHAGRRQERQDGSGSVPAPEREAMSVMGLEPPLTWVEIQSEYKMLVKKYHPDLRGGSDTEAEEMMKKINMAYSVLKIAYQKYRELEGEEI